jgi:transcriptional regulator with XRE-family HTH domain
MANSQIIKTILDKENISLRQLEIRLGLSNGTLRKSIARGGQLKNETILNLVKEFPDINEEALRHGDAENLYEEPNVTFGKRKIEPGIRDRISTFIKARSNENGQTGRLAASIYQTIKSKIFPGSEDAMPPLTILLEHFPELNREWLLYEIGDMIRPEYQNGVPKIIKHPSFENEDDAEIPDSNKVERLFQYFDQKGLTIEAVSKLTNISLSKLNAIKHEREIVDINLESHLSRCFPDLNYFWVQSGKGQMILDESHIKERKELRESIEGKQLQVIHSTYLTEIRKLNDKFLIIMPLVGEFDMNEYIETWGTSYYPEISQFAVCVDSITLGSYLSVYVCDDSMADGAIDSIPHRSIVTGREILREDWTRRSVLNKYKIFIIHTSKDILIRKIASYDPVSNSFRCESYNPDKELYPTIDIKVYEVREIFNIEVITKNL